VWHKDSGGLLEVLEGHDAAVTDVAWNPVQPNLFASCSDDHTVYVKVSRKHSIVVDHLSACIVCSL
jgi:WD40 repeat protein